MAQKYKSLVQEFEIQNEVLLYGPLNRKTDKGFDVKMLFQTYFRGWGGSVGKSRFLRIYRHIQPKQDACAV